MKAYVIRFDGLYLGGKAVVLANSQKEAKKKLCEEHPEVSKYWENSIEFLECYPIRHTNVVYYDSGDY